MNRTTPKRNGAIELLRFLFALVIVLYHGRNIGGGSEHPLFGSFGYISVEFFFIVTGFLMANSAARMENSSQSQVCLGEETVGFVWHKIKRILPYYFLAVLASIPFLFIGKNLGRREFVSRLMMSLWDIGFLGASGIKTYSVVRGGWYLSAMFISLLLLYPLLRKFKDCFTCVIAPLTAIILLGYISQTYGNLNQYIAEYTIVYSGILRAIAELCIGCICYGVYEKIHVKPFTQGARMIISIFCIFGFLGVFLGAHLSSYPYFDFVLLLIIAICTTLVFSKLGAVSRAKIFDHPFFSFLGELGLVLYLNQFWVKSIITQNISKSNGYQFMLAVYVAATFAASLIIMGIVYLLQKFWKQKGTTIKSWFILSEQEES